jgi:hypothetical protein
MIDELHYALADYVGGVIDADELVTWVYSTYSDVEQWGNQTMIGLVYHVKHLIHESMTEESRKSRLAELIPAGVRPE